MKESRDKEDKRMMKPIIPTKSIQSIHAEVRKSYEEEEVAHRSRSLIIIPVPSHLPLLMFRQSNIESSENDDSYNIDMPLEMPSPGAHFIDVERLEGTTGHVSPSALSSKRR